LGRRGLTNIEAYKKTTIGNLVMTSIGVRDKYPNSGVASRPWDKPQQAAENHVPSKYMSLLGSEADVLAPLLPGVETIVHRAPPIDDAGRWKSLSISGHTYNVALPVTFTPYASVRPCSARCLFCSENLRRIVTSTPAAVLRPQGHYMESLRKALGLLRGLPISYSLSGLEATDDPHWLIAVLNVLREHALQSPVESRVLYTNGAGLSDNSTGSQLIESIVKFGFDWVEVSRHHFSASLNQSIMRFRDKVAIRNQHVFESTIRYLAQQVPIKLVCIVQQEGIHTTESILRYVDWAAGLGVSGVIFRELSKLDNSFRMNATARYIATNRVSIARLFSQLVSELGSGAQLKFLRMTDGYYFWNFKGQYGPVELTFEAADYELMHQQHDSGRIYKLVFHANGNLCADWDPERHVLWRPASSGVEA
jgi:hypothetical protein